MGLISWIKEKKAEKEKKKNQKKAKNSEFVKKNLVFFSNKNHWRGVLFVLVVCTCCFWLNYLLESRTINEYRQYYNKYIKGMICEDDVFLSNDIDIVDVFESEKVKSRAADSVLPVFSFSPGTTIQVLTGYNLFTEAVNSGNADGIQNERERYFYNYIRDNDGKRAMMLCYDVIKEVMRNGVFKQNELDEIKEAGYSEIVTINNYLDEEHADNTRKLSEGVYSDFNLSESVNVILDSYKINLALSEKYIIQSLVKIFCRPNVSFDPLQTESRKSRAYEEADNVVVSLKAGMQILQKDTVITDETMQVLRLLTSRKGVNPIKLISGVVFNAFSAIIIYYVVQFFLRKGNVHFKHYYYILLFLIIVLAAACYFGTLFGLDRGVRFIPIFLPVCFLPMHMTMITGRRTFGSISSLVMGLFSLAIPGATYYYFFYTVMLGVASSFLVRFFNRRLEELLQWLLSTIISVALTIVFLFFSYGNLSMSDVLEVVAVKTVISSVSSVILFIFIPVEERLFNLPTKYRLNELFYGGSPLIEKLNKVAPGTYIHSRAVADMAYTACSEIRANAILARVGGLYHDIGKMEHPEYFTENQGKENKHDYLNPELSVSIIKNHVKVGADMGREARLPQEIIYIIANHHGNDVIQYFYNEAKKKADKEDASVTMADYSYNTSEIPNNKECGVVMLADSVEAAARSIHEPTTQKFARLIDSIVERKILMGQLENCPLSMREIKKVKESFLRTLNSLHHSRISYQNDEK